MKPSPCYCWSTEKVKIATMGTNSSMVGMVQRWNVDPEQEHQTQEGSLLGPKNNFPTLSPLSVLGGSGGGVCVCISLCLLSVYVCCAACIVGTFENTDNVTNFHFIYFLLIFYFRKLFLLFSKCLRLSGIAFY